jgi:hypothetical protein
VRHIEAQGGRCAWLVLTFATSEAESASWKGAAVRRLGVFIRWLRRRLGQKVAGKRKGCSRIQPARLEYAASYELTRRGRLHINLIIGAWQFISQRELAEHWGGRVWVKWVKGGGAVGREAAKASTPLAGYLSKLEQAVPWEWHRRVSFSKGWPKAALPDVAKRAGRIVWQFPDPARIVAFEYQLEQGMSWREVKPGEYARLGGESCEFFALRLPPWVQLNTGVLRVSQGFLPGSPASCK